MAENQYVIFKLGNEEYGLEINHVREITEYRQPTKAPNSPSFIDGIINLRGHILPIVNLKKRFNLIGNDENTSNRIVIISIEEKQVGFIVDDASQALRISEENIEDPPELLVGMDRQYIVGIGKVEEKIIILLDLQKLLSKEEQKEITRF